MCGGCCVYYTRRFSVIRRGGSASGCCRSARSRMPAGSAACTSRPSPAADCLNAPANRLLQAVEVAADLLCVGLLAGFNDKNVHGNAPLLLFRFSCGSDILTLNRGYIKHYRKNKCDKHRGGNAAELYIAQEPHTCAV